MNFTKRNFIAFAYYRSQRRREKRREVRRRKRRCPPAPPPSPTSPPPPSSASPPPPLAPSRLPSLPLPRSRTLAPAPAQSCHPVSAPPRSLTPEPPLLLTPEPPLTRSPTHPKLVKRKSTILPTYAFNSGDSNYSSNADSNKLDSDFSTPRKWTKLFSDHDEIKILKGLLYMNKNNDKKTCVTDEVAEHINKSFGRNADFTKTQFRRKIRGMKDKYNKNRNKEGKFYYLCAKIWGDNKEEQNNNEHHDNNEEKNDLITGRRATIKRKFKELDIMTLQLSLKRLALMKETIEAVLEVIQ